MRTIFDTETFHFETKGMLGGGHSLTVSKDGFSYQSANGKKAFSFPFSAIKRTLITNYCNSNQNYDVRCYLKDSKEIPEFELDTQVWNNGHNIKETKALLVALSASKLGSAFPNNLDSLETDLGFTLGEKDIILKDGVIIGAKHQIPLHAIKRCKCVSNGTLGYLCVSLKEKGGFFIDIPDMKLPINEVTLPVLEAVMRRNTGNGIDFSRGNGFDQKDSGYIIIRYMNADFFISEDGTFREPWQESAYRRIYAYGYDVDANWCERMGQ